jgi:hypothetical protein
MTKIEFLQMVPGLLFGISLAEIALFLGKSTKGGKRLYWEHIVLIAISFETIIFNWYIFYDRLSSLDTSYFNFLVQLLSPLASFVYVANLLVENKELDKPLSEYFLKNRKRIFLSLAIFATINILTIAFFQSNFQLGFLPIIPISVILLNAFFDLKWLRIFAYLVKCIQVILVCIYIK